MKTGAMESTREVLVRVDVWPLVTWFYNSAAAPLTLLQPSNSSVYPDWGLQGQICTRLLPPKRRGLCLCFYWIAWPTHEQGDSPVCRLFSRGNDGNPALSHKSSFQAISEASKGDKITFDKPPSSAVFSQVQEKNGNF